MRRVRRGASRTVLPLRRRGRVGGMQTLNLIKGEWVSASSGASLGVVNPATGETIASVPKLGPDEVSGAIEAAWSARRAWAELPAADLCCSILASAQLKQKQILCRPQENKAKSGCHRGTISGIWKCQAQGRGRRLRRSGVGSNHLRVGTLTTMDRLDRCRIPTTS